MKADVELTTIQIDDNQTEYCVIINGIKSYCHPSLWEELYQSVYNTKPRDSKGHFIKRR